MASNFINPSPRGQIVDEQTKGDVSKPGLPVRAKPIKTEAVLRFAEQRRMATALWSRHSVPASDETWLAEWSDGMGERSGGAVWSRGVFVGKPVCRLAESSNLAGRQSGLGAGGFKRDGTSTKRRRGQAGAEWSLPRLVTI